MSHLLIAALSACPQHNICLIVNRERDLTMIHSSTDFHPTPLLLRQLKSRSRSRDITAIMARARLVHAARNNGQVEDKACGRSIAHTAFPFTPAQPGSDDNFNRARPIERDHERRPPRHSRRRSIRERERERAAEGDAGGGGEGKPAGRGRTRGEEVTERTEPFYPHAYEPRRMNAASTASMNDSDSNGA